MQEKLIRLESTADAARAQMRQCGDEVRKKPEELHALDRHAETQRKRGFELSAPDKARHAQLAARVEYLSARYDDMRAEHRAERDLFTRCEAYAHG